MKAKILLLATFIFLTSGLAGCSKGEKVSKTKDFAPDNVSSISMDNDSWDTKICLSNDENIHVKYSGGNEDEITVNLKESKITIGQTDKKNNTTDQFTFGKSGKIVLYLPKEKKVSLDFKNGSGDMEINDISVSNFTIDNDSGYASISDVNAENGKVVSESGDFKVENSTLSNFKIETTSAYVTTKKLIGDDMEIATKSGEVNMNDVENATNVSASTGSGDVTLAYQTIPDNLVLNVSSGSKDITTSLRNIEYITDTSANKQGTIGNGDYKLSIISDSGTVIVK